MAVQVSYPGVYIEEVSPAAPIRGVGTSTAAFLGVTEKGDLDKPVKVTSWDQFRAKFGEHPVPGFFLWYAVRGFFLNGGTVCYICRVSNGAKDTITLQNRAAALGEVDPASAIDAVTLRARQPGNNSNAPIRVSISSSHLAAGATLLTAQTNLTESAAAGDRALVITNASASSFRAGDVVTLGDVGERLVINRVIAGIGEAPDTLRLVEPLANAYSNNTVVRLADIASGTRNIRITNESALAPNALTKGSLLTISQELAEGESVSDSQIVESVQKEPTLIGEAARYSITLRRGLQRSFSLAADSPAAEVQSEEFDFLLSQGGVTTQLNHLSMNPEHPRYFPKRINQEMTLIEASVVEPPPPVSPLASLLADISDEALTGGASEDLGTLATQDFVAALESFREIDDVNLIAIPDNNSVPVQQALIAHCEELADRFAILDPLTPAPNQALFGEDSVEQQRQSLDSERGYAALYYSWLWTSPAFGEQPVLVPPSGHVCGIIARSDANRGVHKAPANEPLKDCLGVERNMSDIDQGQLNLQGINVIRVFNGSSTPILWGARTTATDANWEYVSTRRLFLFIEESVAQSIRGSVFEPNNQQLWQKLKRTISNFLRGIWQDGALFGASAEEAFYVKIDESNNPFSERQAGRLNIEVGVSLVYPAEFIIFTIGATASGTELIEA